MTRSFFIIKNNKIVKCTIRDINVGDTFFVDSTKKRNKHKAMSSPFINEFGIWSVEAEKMDS